LSSGGKRAFSPSFSLGPSVRRESFQNFFFFEGYLFIQRAKARRATIGLEKQFPDEMRLASKRRKKKIKMASQEDVEDVKHA